jgi:hypothetical protein
MDEQKELAVKKLTELSQMFTEITHAFSNIVKAQTAIVLQTNNQSDNLIISKNLQALRAISTRLIIQIFDFYKMDFENKEAESLVLAFESQIYQALEMAIKEYNKLNN